LTRLILVRHAESEMQRRYVGRLEPPLSVRGRAQAAALARRMAGQSLAAVYSSHLKRALTTAQMIAFPHGLEVSVIAELAELDFGDWDGLTYQEIMGIAPQWFNRWLADPLRVCPPNGETLLEMSQRVMEAVNGIIAAHPGETVVVVTHGGPARVIVCHALGMPLSEQWRIRQDLAAVNRLDFDEGWVTLALLNDTCHLQGNISRWENLLECGRKSTFTRPEADLRLHSSSQILKY
jgi:broad specificity phosphatase PhoE